MNLKDYFSIKTRSIECFLEKELTFTEDLPVILNAIKYSVFAGGKRLRPLIAIMACELFEGKEKDVLPFAASIELIHTYSLIHDDLPAMDNDDFRRGKPSNHKVFGDGFAVLAGDALLNKAYEIMLRNIYYDKRDEYIKASYIISKAAGSIGMIGGQSIDLYYENRNISLEKLNEMHDKKTGALITASLEVGAIIAEATENDINNIKEYGKLIGRAFQIRDDILDVKGIEMKMGKTLGKDSRNKKSTYVTYYGLDKSEKILFEIIERAKNIMDVYGKRARYFIELADYICDRDS